MNTTQLLTEFLRADQSLTSNTTLTTITGFSAAMEASRAYAFESEIHFNLAGIVSGQKFSVITPASPTNALYKIEIVNGTGLTIAALSLSAPLAAALATTGLHLAKLGGVIENGVNAGNLVIQFAQNVSDGSAITIKRGSFLKVWNIT